ncbi:MAG: hypothetical protein SF187_09255 [Deltaproteobacteria bacterium]|nr:hypothetical protein [Deltaproteobacteria bacterium]
MFKLINQVVLDRVCYRIHELPHNVVSINKFDNRGLFMGCPKCFPPSSQNILVDCKNAMKILQEIRHPAFCVCGDSVIMIAHHAEPNDANAEAKRTNRDAVKKRVRGFGIRPHEKPTFRATARDKAATVRNNSPWK